MEDVAKFASTMADLVVASLLASRGVENNSERHKGIAID